MGTNKADGTVRNLIRGSITIEAAVSFPVFMLLLLGMVVLIKIFSTHIIINQAISETVKTISSSAYALTALNYLEERGGEFFQSGESESDTIPIASIEAIIDITSEEGDAGTRILTDFTRKYLDTILKNGWDYTFDKYLDLRNEMEISAVSMLIKDKLKGKPINSDKLKLVFVKFPYSSVRSEQMSHELQAFDADDVVVSAEYSIELPYVSILGKNAVLQFNLIERGWVNGYEGEAFQLLPRKSGKASDIWNQDPLRRGREFRRIFGGNLPDNFPAIDRFEAGKAVRIDSMDLRAKTYKNDMALTRTVNSYIDKLALYNGQPVAWRGKKILPGEIKEKELIVIIPLGVASQGQKMLLEGLKVKAGSMGVNMRIVEY